MITYAKLFENAKKKLDLNQLEHRCIYLFLEDILKVDRTKIMLMRDEIVDDQVLERFSEMLADYIIDLKPIEYILGYTYFYGNKISVNEFVLIPRDETEELVEKALEYIKDEDKVLDLCTGSGAIAVALKKSRDNIKVVASDISKEALEVAKMNVKDNKVDVELVLGDLLEPFKGKDKFEVIVCNPPYISKDYVVNDIVKHEPSVALYADDNGLSNYERVIKDLKEILVVGGVLLLEIGFDQKDGVFGLCEKYLDNYEVNCYKDVNGNDRIVVIKLKEC